MIELGSVSKTYSKGKVKAVDSLSLEVGSGCIFGFLGPNGAGKTTTIKMLTGILKHDSGTVKIDGIDLDSDSVSAKRRFSYVPDQPELWDRLKASEYLSFVADAYGVGVDERRERISRYAKAFKIDTALDSRIQTFSHGMKQKLALTASLVSDPPNWILDEPLVGLDPEAAFYLKETMRERAREGKTVFFSTHVMEVAEKLCDRIAVIIRGNIVFSGTVAELRGSGDASLESLFLDLVDSDSAREVP